MSRDYKDSCNKKLLSFLKTTMARILLKYVV